MQTVGSNRLFTGKHVEVFLQHYVCTAVAFFARLEPNDDIAFELVGMGANQVSGSDTHGHVQVMAARVHVAVC